MADPYETLVRHLNEHREMLEVRLENEKEPALLYRAQGGMAIVKNLLEISEQLDNNSYEANQPQVEEGA